MGAILGPGKVDLDIILQNYFRKHEYMQQDMPLLRNKPLFIQFEQLISNPIKVLAQIFQWLNIDSSTQMIRDHIIISNDNNTTNNKIVLNKHPNEKYRKKWCHDISTNEKKRVWAKGIFMKYQPLTDYYKLDSDLLGWCNN